MEKNLLKRLLNNKIKQLGFKGLGCYDANLEKLTKENLDKVIENIKFASTDVQITIHKKTYIVEIKSCNNEIDFDVLGKDVYIARYGIKEEDYTEKFGNL